MASARRTGTNENVSTYGNGTRDYTSLATWEAATDNDLVTATTSEVLECYDDSATFSEEVDLFGATTSALYFRIIRPASGQGHDGTPNTGVTFVNSSTSLDIIAIEESYSSVQDLVFQATWNTSSDPACVFVDEVTNDIVGCIAVDVTNNGAGAACGFQVVGASGGNVINCLAIRCATGFNHYTGATADGFFYNCTAIACTTGFEAQAANVMVVKNCLADGNTTDFSGTFDTASEANASSDATAPGGGPVTSMTFTFVDAAGDDYHLAATDYGAFQRGLDLSADASFAFDDDIDGDTILVWSIGADAQATAISARRRAVGENVSTYGGGARDYTALSTWEAATDIDVVTPKQSEVLECYTDSASYNDSIVMAGATTDASYFRIVRPAVGQGHSGTPTTGIRFEPTSSPTRTVGLDENYSQVQDICALNSTSSSGTRACFWSNAGSNQAFVGCIGKGTNPGSGAGYAFLWAATGGPNVAVDCLGYDSKNANFISTGAGTVLFLSCTSSAGVVSGFAASAGTITATNCLAYNAGSTGFSGTFGTESYNASSDTTAAGTGSRVSQTFTFEAAGSLNFHLEFEDAGAKGYGTSLAAHATYPFTDDIDGDTISVWSIGFHSDPADDAAGGGEGVFLRRRRR